MSSLGQLLLIDEDPQARAIVRRAVQSRWPDARVEEVADLVGFVRMLDRADHDAVVVDVATAWGGAPGLIELLVERAPGVPVLVFSEATDVQTVVDAIRRGAAGYIPKSLGGLDQLLDALSRLGQERDEISPLRAAPDLSAPAASVAPATPAPAAPKATPTALLHAAHDLVEPLRSVAGYLHVIESRYGAALTPDALDLVASAQQSARDLMDRVQTILLSNTPATSNTPLRHADCDEVLKRTLAGLRSTIEASGAVISSDPLPAVAVEPDHVARVLQNLLSNAIKFRRDAPPRIHVGVEDRDDAWIFSIEDNGLGVAPDDAERIFRMFERGRHGAALPGSGIGLAICKRVVEQDGGRIWLESTPGVGTTFYFTLPKVTESAEPPSPSALSTLR